MRVIELLAFLLFLLSPSLAVPLTGHPWAEDHSLLQLSNATTSSSQASSTLRSCLSRTGVQIVYASGSSYPNLIVQQNAALPSRKPSAFALPKDEQGVAAVVRCVAAEHGRHKISPRSGGHSYAGYDLGGADGWIVVDLRHLNTVVVDRGMKQATVGGGARLGPMAEALASQGFALPHGTCPSVGVGGHSLAGGYGFTSFTWGYLLDRIASMRLVKPDGSIITVSSSQHSDLFYALRGAGQNNFGIVTSFTYKLETAPSQIVNFAQTFASDADCVKVILVVQGITERAGEEGWSKLLGGQVLLEGEKGSPGASCTFSGMFLGPEADYLEAIGPLMSALKNEGVVPAQVKQKAFNSWLEALKDIMGSLEVTGFEPEPYYAKSLITPMSIRYNESSAAALMAALKPIAKYGPSVSLDLLGPNSYSNGVPANSTAFVHRDALWVSQYYAYLYPKTNAGGKQDTIQAAFARVVKTAKAVDPLAKWGGYYNYVDARLLTQDWGKFYWGSEVGRLQSMKKAVDPQNIFDFPMAINRAR